MQATVWPKAGGSSSCTRDCSRFNNCKKFAHCQVRANETYSEAKSQFVTGTGMFLSIPSPLINCGQLLSLRCSARVRLCLCLLVRVLNWWALPHCVRFLFFPASSTNVTRPSSSTRSLANANVTIVLCSTYLPISITSVLSKLFECLVSVRLGRFMERSDLLPIIQFAYWKIWYL